MTAFLFIGLIFVFLEFKLLRDNYSYLVIILGITVISSTSNIWNIDLFNIISWKLLFLSLISLSFIMVIFLLQEKSFDIYCLLVLVYIGSVILIISDNLLTIYLGLELQTFSIFILIAKNRTSIKSSEAGLKYFMLGAISSGFYLLSLVILFFFGFSLNVSEIVIFSDDYVVGICITLICLSICFKLSLFPFHFWIPDIYEGSSWDILMLISSLPKISVICIITQILTNSNILLTFSLLSIAIGTLGALNQSKLKRFLAYSGVSHMGFIVLGYIMFSNSNNIVGSLYLLIYIVGMLSVLILIIKDNMKNDYIIELGGLKFTNKILAITIILLILSLGGIPPLSGFISKWYLIWVAIEGKYYISCAVVVLFSIIGLGYYLRIVKTVYFQRKSSYFAWKALLQNESSSEDISYLCLGLMFFMGLFLIFNFTFIINLLDYIFTSLY